MQTIPTVITSWSKRNPPGAFWEDVTGSDFNSGDLQIQIGVDLLKRIINQVKHIIPEIPQYLDGQLNEDFAKFCLVAYAWGIGRLTKKILEMRQKNLAINWNTFQQTYPDLGKPANRPLYYANKVWGKAKSVVDPSSPPFWGGLGAIALVSILLYVTMNLKK
jgi:hypothetical protein